MSDPASTLITAILIVVGLPLLLTVPMVYARTRLPGTLKWQGIDLDTRPWVDAEWLGAATGEFARLGFTAAGDFQYFVHDDALSAARKVVHRSLRVAASLSLMRVEDQTFRLVELTSTTRDGVTLMTTDSSLPRTLPEAAHLRVLQLAPGTSPSALLAAHRDAIEEAGGTEALREVEPREAGRETAEVIRRVCQDHVESGILQYDEEEDVYRPTLVGAFVLAARQWRTVFGPASRKVEGGRA